MKGVSRIEAAFESGTQEFYSYKCPNCGEFHYLNYRNFVTVEDKIKFRCPDCGFEFSEQEIKTSPQKYIAKNPDALKEGIRSFCVNAFSSPWLSWERIFQDYRKAKGNPAQEKVVFNTRFAESYELRGNEADEDDLLKNRLDYPAELPSDVLILTAAVDVQGNRLEFEIVGWAKGEISYGILRGVILGTPADDKTWLELDKVLDREYHFADGRALKVARTFVDSGFAARKVYAYCRQNLYKGRYAIKGKGAPGLPLIYQYSHPKGEGITLTILGVNDGKQEIFSRLKNKLMQFPRDDIFFNRRGYDEIYFKQLFSEKQTLKRSGGVAYLTFQPISRDVRNESLDLAVYNIACFRSLNVDFEQLDLAIHGEEITIQKPVIKRKKIISKTLEIF